MTRSGRDTTLDVVRAVAALGVVATHARWLSHGTSGRTSTVWDALHASVWQGSRTTVYLFFALSGFLIARPYVAALLDGSPLPMPGRYAARRLARIAPAYWIAFSAFLALGFGVGANLRNVADHYLLVHNEVPGDAGNLLPVAWTLGIEATFYVAVPLAAHLVRRVVGGACSRAGLVGSVVAIGVASAALHLAVLTRIVPTGWGTVVQYSLPAQLLFFIPGIVIAALEHRHAPSLLPRPTLVAGLAACVVAWVGCMYLLVVSTIPAGISSIGFAIVSAAVLTLARRCREPRSAPARALAWVGTVSYGLYLWHWIVMRAMFGRWGAALAGTHAASWPLATVVLLALTLPVAAASWYLVERPLMRLAAARTRSPVAARLERRLGFVVGS